MNLLQEKSWKTLEKVIKTVERKPVLEDITVVIPTLGRPILEECLIRIVHGTHWPKALIIVHQGDQPAIRDWIKQINEAKIQAVYIHSTELGKPAAANLAFKNTQTKFVCMIDDDCFVDTDWLQKMYNRLQVNPNWVITGRVEPAGNETIAIVQIREPMVFSRPRLQFDLFVGGNMGASLDVIRRVGPFDEDPLLRNAAEDVEWGYRALKKGVPIAYAPEVAVSHFGWRVEKEIFERLRVYAHGHGSFYGKYLRKGDFFILLRAMLHFLRAFRRWVYGTLKGKKDHAMSGRAYCMGLLPGILAGFRSQVDVGELK